MLTYNSKIHLGFMFQGDSDPSIHARKVLASGNLVRPRSSFVASETKEAVPGRLYDDWLEKKGRFSIHFTPDKTLFIVNQPTWCHCPGHFREFAKTYEWAEKHLGYVSLIFLYGETLFEALAPIQRDGDIGKDLLEFVSESHLLQHPELVFIPLLESAKP